MMQCNKDVDSTSSKKSVSDASKFQSLPISLYNVDNKAKSVPLLLSTTSKVFQCKETGVQVSTDNGQKNKLNSCKKKDSNLLELYFRIRRFILLVQTKKVISMNCGRNTRNWKPRRWIRLDLIFSMRDIYINSNLNPLTKFTSSSRSTKFKDILPWNISQMITKTIPISTRIVITYAMKRGIPLWIWWKVNGNWAIKWWEFPNGGKAIVE